MVLRNLSLSISAGEKIAICGRTGSGKSSLVLLLGRFINPAAGSGGSVVIDDLDISSVAHATVRERIITLPQHAYLLPESGGCSVRANLDLLPDGDGADGADGGRIDGVRDGHCTYALQAVGLWDLVQEHGGLGAELKPDSLSEGQKQLFCLARAVLRKRLRSSATTTSRTANSGSGATDKEGGVLILDEFNANVDTETDRLMQAVVRREFVDYTVICVAHRLNSVLNYDRVVVMDSGRIVETGAPRELVTIPGSRFADMWRVGKDRDDVDGLEAVDGQLAGR